MLRGEFHKSLPLLLTGQQLSVFRSLVYYSSSTHFLFETGIRLTRYGRFVNEILTMHRAKQDHGYIKNQKKISLTALSINLYIVFIFLKM